MPRIEKRGNEYYLCHERRPDKEEKLGRPLEIAGLGGFNAWIKTKQEEGLTKESYYITHKDTDELISRAYIQTEGDTTLLKFVETESKFKGEGLASKLIKTIENRSKEQGVKKLLLKTVVPWRKSFYKQAGFKETWPSMFITLFLRSGHKTMVKNLEQANP